jgi:hypothetical protein
MIARIIVQNEERWYRNVVSTSSDGRYLTLQLDARPTRVVYLLAKNTSVLLCADDDEVTKALRAEHTENRYCTCLSGRDPLCVHHGGRNAYPTLQSIRQLVEDDRNVDPREAPTGEGRF